MLRMIYVTVYGEALLSDEEVDLSAALQWEDWPDARGVADQRRHRISQSHSTTSPFRDNPTFQAIKTLRNP